MKWFQRSNQGLQPILNNLGSERRDNVVGRRGKWRIRLSNVRASLSRLSCCYNISQTISSSSDNDSIRSAENSSLVKYRSLLAEIEAEAAGSALSYRIRRLYLQHVGALTHSTYDDTDRTMTDISSSDNSEFYVITASNNSGSLKVKTFEDGSDSDSSISSCTDDSDYMQQLQDTSVRNDDAQSVDSNESGCIEELKKTVSEEIFTEEVVSEEIVSEELVTKEKVLEIVRYEGKEFEIARLSV